MTGARSQSARHNTGSRARMQRPFHRPKAKIHRLETNKRNIHVQWWYAIFIFSGVSLLICLLQIILQPPFGLRMPSSDIAEIGIATDGCDDGMDRCICPRETICATDKLSMVLLTLARCFAFLDYPLYMMMFLSKAHNINNIFRRTVLREWIDFSDMHRIHSIFGVVVGVETMFHSFFHMLRWGINNEIQLLWGTNTGITGFIAAAATPFIVWPMAIPKLKTRISFEVRKGLHYLSYFWAIALMCHAPSRIYFLIGIPFLIYVVDFTFGFFVRNHLIEDVFFERYGEKGVALHFENPNGYGSRKTSYVYIMCPWISKWQWHAFTMFPEPTKKNHTMLCIGTSGDWTKAMFDMIRAPCLRSMYIIGPFSSEFSDKAVNTTNAIAIASGIGITPTLSLMLSYAGKKRINIIWMCRDPGLVEYFLHKVDITAVTKNSFALIFYTGKRDLVLPKNLPINFFIFRSRPKLEDTISGIIAAIHSGEGLPEEMYENQKALANIPFNKRIKIALSRITTIYSKEKMFDYAVEETDAAEFAVESDVDMEAGSSEQELLDHSDSDSTDDSKYSTFVKYVEEGAKTAPVGKVVSMNGLESMICSFLGGIGEYSRVDIENLFKLVDTDESGYIDKDEFDDFIALATGEKYCDETALKMSMVLERSLTKRASFRSSMRLSVESHFKSDASKKESMIGDESTIKYMENLVNNAERPLDDWSMFYCGGSTPIEKTLRSMGKKYKIDVGVEKFDW